MGYRDRLLGVGGQDSKAIADIMKSLGLPSYRAPPPLISNTSTQIEPFYEAAPLHWCAPGTVSLGLVSMFSV